METGQNGGLPNLIPFSSTGCPFPWFLKVGCVLKRETGRVHIAIQGMVQLTKQNASTTVACSIGHPNLRRGPFRKSFKHTNTMCKLMGQGWLVSWMQLFQKYADEVSIEIVAWVEVPDKTLERHGFQIVSGDLLPQETCQTCVVYYTKFSECVHPLDLVIVYFTMHWADVVYTPKKLTCPLKRDYFNRKYIFQQLIFRGHMVVFRGCNISPTIKCTLSRWFSIGNISSNGGCSS